MTDKFQDIRESVADYYTRKLARHGPTAQGVDWNDMASQELRFNQLLKLCEGDDSFSLNEYGCGYGHLCGYLKRRGLSVTYHGFDLSPSMVAAAKRRYGQGGSRSFEVAAAPKEMADYSLASGIFNVRFGFATEKWSSYVASILDDMNEKSRKGFAFNCLTKYSDPHFTRDDLYYGDPCYYFDLCKKKYAQHVALLHDYGLYEFTIVVRK